MKTIRCDTCDGEMLSATEHVDAGEAANCADIRGDHAIETHEHFDFPLGTAHETHDPHGRLLSVIGEPETSHSGNTILRVGRQVRPGGGWEQTEHVVLEPGEVEVLLNAISPPATTEDAAVEYGDVVATANGIGTLYRLRAEMCWPSPRYLLEVASGGSGWMRVDGELSWPQAMDAMRAATLHEMLQEGLVLPDAPAEPERSPERTILLSVSLRAADGFDDDAVCDRDSDDLEADQPSDLADHLALYIGAALDGLHDRRGRSLGLKHVSLIDVLDGDV